MQPLSVNYERKGDHIDYSCNGKEIARVTYSNGDWYVSLLSGFQGTWECATLERAELQVMSIAYNHAAQGYI